SEAGAPSGGDEGWRGWTCDGVFPGSRRIPACVGRRAVYNGRLARLRRRLHLPRMYNRSSEPVRFERDCDVVLVPQGERVTLPAGSVGYITQALGGRFTVFVEGNLFRIDGKDADAIGKEPPEPLAVANAEDDDEIERLAWQQLRTCFDPEIPVDIVELGLVYRCEVQRLADGQRQISIDMTLTAPGCGMGEFLVEDV